MKLLAIAAMSCSLSAISAGSVITSGTVTIALNRTGTFSLSGSDFNVTGFFYQGTWGSLICPTLCAPGSQLTVGGLVSGGDIAGGSAIVNAVTFPNLSWYSPNQAGGSTLQVTAPSIALTNGAGTYRGNFTFTGQVCGVVLPSSTIPDPCVVNFPNLTGSGYVDVNLVAVDLPGFSGLVFNGATYTFTPEPVTSALVLAGLVLLVGAARIRDGRKSSRPVSRQTDR